MRPNVRYEKMLRERAIAEKKWLVTISVYGKHLKDDSIGNNILAESKGEYDVANGGGELC